MTGIHPRVKLTAFLVRGLNVVSIANQSADGLPQAVPVGLLGALIQQNIGNQARVALAFQILQGEEAVREKVKHPFAANAFPTIGGYLINCRAT